IMDGGRGAEGGAAREVAGQVRGRAEREPGLTRSPAPRQGQEPGRGQQPLDLGQLATPADEARQVRRQVAGSRPGGPSRHLMADYTPVTPPAAVWLGGPSDLFDPLDPRDRQGLESPTPKAVRSAQPTLPRRAASASSSSSPSRRPVSGSRRAPPQ